jgi:hypothetical protein
MTNKLYYKMLGSTIKIYKGQFLETVKLFQFLQISHIQNFLMKYSLEDNEGDKYWEYLNMF